MNTTSTSRGLKVKLQHSKKNRQGKLSNETINIHADLGTAQAACLFYFSITTPWVSLVYNYCPD